MTYNQAVLTSEIISALVRILPALICFDLSMKLAPNRPNYVNAPPLFRGALCFSGVFIMTSMADLIYRAFTTSPPHPLATGYTTSISEVGLALFGHIWLQQSWKPAAVRAQLNKKAELWERLAPCTRREQIVKERRRNAIPAKVAIGPCEPPKTFAEVVSDLDDSEFAPVTHDMDAVIPDSLRE